ncbi:hypothetical protein [Mycobacterium sp.]|uniref:hypothetical protein n=1 Tax=Mycobacterium sp. TaxID=1785 RepID=UPI003D0D0738
MNRNASTVTPILAAAASRNGTLSYRDGTRDNVTQGDSFVPKRSLRCEYLGD